MTKAKLAAHARPYLDHHAGALMAQNHRPRAPGFPEINVGMADAGCFDPD